MPDGITFNYNKGPKDMNNTTMSDFNEPLSPNKLNLTLDSQGAVRNLQMYSSAEKDKLAKLSPRKINYSGSIENCPAY